MEKSDLVIPEEGRDGYFSRYESLARSFGADDVKAVYSKDLKLTEKARNKCRIPRCMEYGTNAHCPPHSPTASEMQEILKEYTWGIVFKVEVEGAIIAHPSMGACLLRQEFDNAHKLRDLGKAYKQTFRIASEVESTAFYDGFYFSLGFAAGSCKGVFCFQKECQALVPGKPCRYPLKARPSLEAVGFDVFHLAISVGWNINPIGSKTKPNEISNGSLIGLILID